MSVVYHKRAAPSSCSLHKVPVYEIAVHSVGSVVSKIPYINMILLVGVNQDDFLAFFVRKVFLPPHSLNDDFRHKHPRLVQPLEKPVGSPQKRF